MPPKPAWHALVPTVLRRLEGTDSPVLDRQSIEQLFGVRSRTAQNLLRSFGGYRAGNALVVDRGQLIEALRTLSDPAAVAEQARRARVVRVIETLRAAPRAKIPIPVPATPSNLPQGVSLPSAGILSIEFSRPEELLSRVLALTQLAAKDFAGFVTLLTPARSVCTDRSTSDVED